MVIKIGTVNAIQMPSDNSNSDYENALSAPGSPSLPQTNSADVMDCEFNAMNS